MHAKTGVESMNLTKNERRTLRLLLANPRIQDTEIARQLNITSQAIGKIRKKLEETIIDRYRVDLSHAQLGVTTFALGIAKLTEEGKERGETEVENILINHPNIVRVNRLSGHGATHLLHFAFRGMDELENFFHAQRMQRDLHALIEQQQFYLLSNQSLLKNDATPLYHKILDDLECQGSER